MKLNEYNGHDPFEGIPTPDGAYAGPFDCREGRRMRLYESATDDFFMDCFAELRQGGYSVLQERLVNGNRFAALQNGEKRVNLLFTPCDGTLRMTAADREEGIARERVTVFMSA